LSTPSGFPVPFWGARTQEFPAGRETGSGGPGKAGRDWRMEPGEEGHVAAIDKVTCRSRRGYLADPGSWSKGPVSFFGPSAIAVLHSPPGAPRGPQLGQRSPARGRVSTGNTPAPGSPFFAGRRGDPAGQQATVPRLAVAMRPRVIQPAAPWNRRRRLSRCHPARATRAAPQDAPPAPRPGRGGPIISSQARPERSGSTPFAAISAQGPGVAAVDLIGGPTQEKKNGPRRVHSTRADSSGLRQLRLVAKRPRHRRSGGPAPVPGQSAPLGPARDRIPVESSALAPSRGIRREHPHLAVLHPPPPSRVYVRATHATILPF